MGAWGAGAFENDDALDWIADLDPAKGWAHVVSAFDAVTAPGEYTDVDVGTATVAAAEVVAASRGWPAPDLPDTLLPYLRSVGAADADLTARASAALSNVLLEPSELVELWAESEDAEKWNLAITGLVERLSMSPRKLAPPAPRPKSGPGGFICAFCNERIDKKELVVMTLERDPGEHFERRIYGHFACLNSKTHPARIVQWWRSPSG